MAVTHFQRSICRLIADHRKQSGVSYVAGGVATIIDLLPPEQAGNCVLDTGNSLFTGGSGRLPNALAQRQVRFHAGSLGGAYPRLVT